MSAPPPCPRLTLAPHGANVLVRLESTLPEFDEVGRLGFVAVLTSPAGAADPRPLLFPSARTEWVVPSTGKLKLGTGALGWSLELPLSPGLRLDPQRTVGAWKHAAAEFVRAELSPEALQRIVSAAKRAGRAEKKGG